MIDVSEQLARAVSLREAGSVDEARDLLLKLSSAATGARLILVIVSETVAIPELATPSLAR